ncbi:uncharacterized protein LAESUDRAFT_396221 [Laetiporus sulphureus 93-53]|uniref:Uncharacterized protein n=1 Tax=Laetiporus sulphureus 93-53 TaxID=1314785 RepID=A0A165CEI0_9APHY|nr:uncharacterized protein LAESUDRAFT_396221 [Laetiporus sulphureus 93-53]KZT02669.1 hypothetical protein LAESUDRAFT_396221 [Laetiporus sulphureus 93-53]
MADSRRQTAWELVGRMRCEHATRRLAVRKRSRSVRHRGVARIIARANATHMASCDHLRATALILHPRSFEGQCFRTCVGSLFETNCKVERVPGLVHDVQSLRKTDSIDARAGTRPAQFTAYPNPAQGSKTRKSDIIHKFWHATKMQHKRQGSVRSIH